MPNTSSFRMLALLIGTLFFSGSYAADADWICANQKTDIPDGYFAVEVSEDFDACEYPKQHVRIKEISDANFWMCSFDNIGVPAGFVLNQTSTGSTCGCREVAQTAKGAMYCATIGARDLLGWPIISISRRYR